MSLTVTHNGAVYYYVTNLQGDIIAILNSTGKSVATYSYDAWGNPLDTPTEPIANLNPLRYRGYVYDTETGLYYLQSRYYDPNIGRFLSTDGLVSTGQGILGNNMYAYCLDNPVNFFDDSGNIPKWLKGAWDTIRGGLETADGVALGAIRGPAINM